MPTPAETRATAAEAMQTSFAAFLSDLADWRAAATAHADATEPTAADSLLRVDRHIAGAIVGAIRTVLAEAHHVSHQMPLAVVEPLDQVDAALVAQAEP